MASYLPTFNLTADVWYNPNTPNTTAPDLILVKCQLYLVSRGMLDITPGAPLDWTPPIYLRLDPAGAPYDILSWIAGIADPVSLRTLYFRVRYKEWMHMGFANQYPSWVVEQCNGNGTAILRDVP